MKVQVLPCAPEPVPSTSGEVSRAGSLEPLALGLFGSLVTEIPEPTLAWWNGRHSRLKNDRKKACEFDSRGEHDTKRETTMHTRTLLLSPWYIPLKVLRWQDAVKMRYEGTADVLAEYEDEIASPSVVWKMPAVMRLRRMPMPRKRGLRFSRLNVYQRDGFRCQYCGGKFPVASLSYDHVVPRSAGGSTTWTNIVTACKSAIRERRITAATTRGCGRSRPRAARARCHACRQPSIWATRPKSGWGSCAIWLERYGQRDPRISLPWKVRFHGGTLVLKTSSLRAGFDSYAFRPWSPWKKLRRAQRRLLTERHYGAGSILLLPPRCRALEAARFEWLERSDSRLQLRGCRHRRIWTIRLHWKPDRPQVRRSMDSKRASSNGTFRP